MRSCKTCSFAPCVELGNEIATGEYGSTSEQKKPSAAADGRGADIDRHGSTFLPGTKPPAWLEDYLMTDLMMDLKYSDLAEQVKEARR